MRYLRATTLHQIESMARESVNFHGKRYWKCVSFHIFTNFNSLHLRHFRNHRVVHILFTVWVFFASIFSLQILICVNVMMECSNRKWKKILFYFTFKLSSMLISSDKRWKLWRNFHMNNHKWHQFKNTQSLVSAGKLCCQTNAWFDGCDTCASATHKGM